MIDLKPTMFPLWAKNILFLLVYMISGLILALIIEGLLSGSDLLPVNVAIESAMVGIRMPILTTLIVFFTNLADPFYFSIVAVAIAIWLIMKKDTYDAALFLISLIVAVVSFTMLKNYLQITRPVSDIYQVAGWSFPSGHATLSTAFFFLLSYIFYKKMKRTQSKVYLIGGSFLGVFLVCFSRLYLGAHWALDILAGIALGLMTVSFTVLMFNLFVGENRSIRHLLAR